MNNMDTDLETAIAAWVVGLTLQDIPQNVRSVALDCITDGVGVMIAGTETPIFAQACALPRHEGPCCLADGSQRTESRHAALLNGIAAHALDFDDTSYAGIVHGTAVVLPAVLAVGQEINADGRRLIEAFVAGVEVEYALGIALSNTLYERGFWTTATLGVLGAAAAAAKLLGLDIQTTAQALRLAANQPIGLRVTHGSTGKPYLCGVASRAGIDAALAAQVGVGGRPGTLERARGYASALNDGFIEAGAVDALGKRYALLDPGIAFKLRPLCSAMQAAVDAVLSLRAISGWTTEQIERVRCYGTALVVTSLPYCMPSSPAEAQFCMPFSVACTLLYGDVRLEHLTSATLKDPALVRLMERVELLEDQSMVSPDQADACPEPVRVEIHLRGGKVLSRSVFAAVGMPQNPATPRAMREKFLACVSRSLLPVPAEELWKRLQSLDQLASVRSLLSGRTDIEGRG